MADDRYDRVKHDGKTVDKYTDYNIHLAEERLGYELSIVQGSYNKGVGASAGTHDGAGVIDLKPWDWQNKVRVLRELGFAAWYRPYRKGVWPAHIHAVLLGNEKASPLAKQQMTAYRNGRDGLAGNGRDTFWRPNPIKDAAYKTAAPTPAAKKPADVIDIASYKLTKDDGKEVKQPALDDYSDARFHVTASGDGVAFRARCGGGTTPNSTHTRCELREMANRGLNLASWDNRRGTHEQQAAYRIEHLPKNKPEAVVAQIHDKSDDVVMVRAVGDPRNPLGPIKVYAEWSKGKGKGSTKELLGQVRLDQKFYVRIVADKAGIRVRFQVSGTTKVTERKRSTARAGLYFKAGCYNQSDTEHDKATDYAEIVIYKDSLKVRHVV